MVPSSVTLVSEDLSTASNSPKSPKSPMPPKQSKPSKALPPTDPNEQKRCSECFKMHPITMYTRFLSSGRFAAMCHPCREAKNKYMRSRREKLRKANDGTLEVEETPETAFEELVKRRRESDKTYTSLDKLFKYLRKSSVHNGELVTAQLEVTAANMPSLTIAESEKDLQLTNQVITEAKKLLRDNIAAKLGDDVGYRWCVYRLSTSGRSLYMTLYCSEDKALIRPSVSTGMRKKNSKKTVDCKSQIHVTYNWSTQKLKLTYTHLNHVPEKPSPTPPPNPSGTENENADESEALVRPKKRKTDHFVDPVIDSMQREAQEHLSSKSRNSETKPSSPDNQTFLKKILN